MKLRIEVEVANFYPAIAASFSTPVYEATQSSIHVLVTHAFLRSLATLDLAESKVGRFAAGRAAARRRTRRDERARQSATPRRAHSPDAPSSARRHHHPATPPEPARAQP